MSFNLIDSVKGLFGNEFMEKAASTLGESEVGLQKAIGGIIPSVLTGVLSKAGSGDADGILNMAKDSAGSGIHNNLSGLLSSGSNPLSKGADTVKGLFGDKADNITRMISSYSGIKESSASSLMSMAAPATLGVFGKHVSETNMSASGLLSFLNSQKDSIMSALPSGLNLAGSLGLTSLGAIGSKLSGTLSGITGGVRDVSDTLKNSVESVGKTSGNMRWLWPVVLIIAAVGLLWWLIKGCNQTTSTPPTVTTTTVDSLANTVSSVPEMLKVKLPDGVEIDAYKGGIEDQLVTFLNDSSKMAGKDVWFDFDNLNFETGSTTITEESKKQVQNIAAILKAYPQLAIKLGGYTDKTGDSLANIKLSKSRADAVVVALKTIGANMSQVTGTEGYGSLFAKAAADAPDEERKKDRRIAISVRKK